MKKAIVKIMGGIGNQLFQYAFSKELEDSGDSVSLDVSYFENIPECDTKRELVLDKLFDISVASKSDIRKYVDKRKIRKYLYQNYRVICQSPDTKIEEAGSNTYYVGYWQSETYFRNIKEKLKESLILAISEHISDDNLKWKEKILQEQNAVAIHVRGGDYRNNINIDNLGSVCTKEYYCKAIEYIKNKKEGCKFFVFTNDADYVKEMLPESEDYVYINNSESDGLKDIYLMSLCKSNIIANSSFSWWGAWLNKAVDKIVVAPSKWNAEDSNRDIYCDGWVRI